MDAGHETPPPHPEMLQRTLHPTDMHRETTYEPEKSKALLEELRKSWSVSDLTPAQLQRKEDYLEARKLQDKVLAVYHRRTNPTYWKDNIRKINKGYAPYSEEVHEEDRDEDHGDPHLEVLRRCYLEDSEEDGDEIDDNTSGTSSSENSTSIIVDSPFLKLPGELKNQIYDLCLSDYKELQRTRRRPVMLHHRPANEWKEKGRTFITNHRPDHLLIQELHRRYKRLAKYQLEHARYSALITEGAITQFQCYQAEHNISKDRCCHEIHQDGVIYINERGNLCDDLPNLALTNREIFTDIFSAMYLDKKKKLPGRVQARVEYLDFFPLLRFCQMLGRGPSPIFLPGSMVTVELSEDIPDSHDIMFVNRFQNMKRLVELHWFDGFPLWPCLTGLSLAPEQQDEEIEDDDLDYRCIYLTDESDDEEDYGDDDEDIDNYYSHSEPEQEYSSLPSSSQQDQSLKRASRARNRNRVKKLKRAQEKRALAKEIQKLAKQERKLAKQQERKVKEAMRYAILIQLEKDERETDRESTTDTTGPFGDFMYSVRQIVALYRIDNPTWRRISIKHLRAFEILDKIRWRQMPTEWDKTSDPIVVEYVIEMLCSAIEYRLSRDTFFFEKGRDGKYMGANGRNACFIKDEHRVRATPMEQTLIDHVMEYRVEVDRALKELLGDEYEEWEKLPEKEVIPQGVVL